MKRLKQATSLSLMGFSVLIIISSLKLGVGDLRSPGPGFMGFVGSMLLFILSLVILIQDSLRLTEEKGIFLSGTNLYKQFIITIALCGYALLLEPFGFLISGFILMWVMFMVESPKRWLYHMLMAFIVINVSYLVLSKLLRVIFPAGIFRIQW